MKFNFTFSLLLCIFSLMKSQVGIGTTSPDPGTVLDLVSVNKGLLIPRVSLLSTIDVTTIPVSSNDEGIIIYNLTDAGVAPENVFSNTFYIWTDNAWQPIGELPEIQNQITNNNSTQQFFSGQRTFTTFNFTAVNTYSPWTVLNYNTEYYDGLNIHSAGNITLPETGLYSLSAYISPSIPARGGGAVGVRIMDITNNTELSTSYKTIPASNSFVSAYVPLHWTGQITAGTQIQIQFRIIVGQNQFSETPSYSGSLLVNKHL